jgi:hypothetical protein
MTATDIFARLDGTYAGEILNWLAENDRPAYRKCAGLLATRRNLRPVFVERKPKAERNQWIKDALARPANADLALEILQIWTLGCNEQMVCDFLDALEIPHNGKGLIDDLPAEPDGDRIAKAVEGLLAKYPAPSVFVYLHLFSGMNPDDWPVLRGLLESHPALAPERALSPL